MGIVEVSIVSVVLVFWIFGAIVRKAGFARWWSLLLLVPVLNVVLIWIFAFTSWPAVRDGPRI